MWMRLWLGDVCLPGVQARNAHRRRAEEMGEGEKVGHNRRQGWAVAEGGASDWRGIDSSRAWG